MFLNVDIEETRIFSLGIYFCNSKTPRCIIQYYTVFNCHHISRFFFIFHFSLHDARYGAQWKLLQETTMVNVYVDLVVFTRIAGTS